MARKEASITIEAPGRDQGKTFILTEMPASKAEAWGARLMLALSRAGVDVPLDFFEMGMAGVAVMGLKAMGGLSWDVAKPLLDEMMACVRIKVPAGVRDLNEDAGDIEEVKTRLRLRDEVINLHLSFSVAAFISNFQKTMAERAEQAAEIAIGRNTAMSPSASEESSPPGTLN
jgi:hypothetical protein